MAQAMQFSESVPELNHDFHILRFLTAAPAALVMTLGLIWGMERLIHSDDNLKIPEPPIYVVPNPVLDIVEPTPVQRTKPEPPKPVEDIPELPETNLHVESQVDPGTGITKYIPEKLDPGVGHFSSNVPVATLMVQPNYPALAASRGYEGYVDVQFDVAATGATENVVAIASAPSNVFEKAAVRAVKRWKFSPVMADGKAQKYLGMVQRLTFELEN